MSRTPDVIGLDLGGSKTSAVRVADGILRDAVAGSANLTTLGAEEAGRALDAALAGLGELSGVDAVCAGAAGVDCPAAVERLRGLLAARLPGARVLVVHDTELVLATARLDEGVVLISGTGSVAWGRRRDGRHCRAGGWGYLLGDEGSGYWVAGQAVRHVLSLVDRGLPADSLTRALLTDCGLTSSAELLAHFYAHVDRRYWAERAQVVAALADAGDPVAAGIVERAGCALADLVRCVGDRLAMTGPVVLAGGFAVHHPVLRRAVSARLPGTEIRVLEDAPVVGAVRLATALAQDTGYPTPPPLEEVR